MFVRHFNAFPSGGKLEGIVFSVAFVTFREEVVKGFVTTINGL